MLGLKAQVFGNVGYSTDMQLTAAELDTFRTLVSEQWLSIINTFHPDLFEEAKKLGIENYHQIAHRVNHQKLWPKSNRVLPQKSVNQIKKLPFLSKLKEEFGEFTISDVYDTEQHYGQEEIYWRLVRPNIESDVGPLHKDKWFHGAFNSGYGMFPEDVVTVKLWIPIYCEAGKCGLALGKGSHLKEWKYHIEVIDGIPRPKPDEDLSDAGAQLISSAAGNILIFNEGVIHGGVLNSSDKTRVSAEITMVMKKETSHLDITNHFSENISV